MKGVVLYRCKFDYGRRRCKEDRANVSYLSNSIASPRPPLHQSVIHLASPQLPVALPHRQPFPPPSYCPRQRDVSAASPHNDVFEPPLVAVLTIPHADPNHGYRVKLSEPPLTTHDLINPVGDIHGLVASSPSRDSLPLSTREWIVLLVGGRVITMSNRY